MIENLAASLRLLLVTDDALLGERDPVDACCAAVRGGATAVQLRLKHADDRLFMDIATRLRASLDVPLFINDRLDIALACGADGVHLGADDLAPAVAALAVRPGFVIGASVGIVSEIDRGSAAHYWGIGPLHGTATKADAGQPLGWDGAGALLAKAGERPCVIIGGVRPEDAPVARRVGFAGVAVSGGILAQDDVERAARRYG